MGMWHHHKSSEMGMMGILLAIVGLVVFAVLVYELIMNRQWIVQHIPEDVRKAMPEPVTKALES